MAKVAVTHPGMGDDEAKIPPKRELIPEGKYAAVIMTASVGEAAWTAPPTPKIRCEFQLTHRILEGSVDESEQGRRVYQDFLLAPIEEYPDLAQQHRYELRQLLDACNIERDEDGSFDTDHLLQKPVIIDVFHRPGKEKDRDPVTKELPVYTNIKRIEGPEEVAADDLV